MHKRDNSCLLALLLMSACTDVATSDDPTEVDEAEQTIYANTRGYWNKRVIDVCWDASAYLTGYDAHRKLAREAVEGAWERVSNIDFRGWGPCASSWDVRVTVADTHATADIEFVRGDGTKKVNLNFTYQSDVYPSCRTRVGECIRRHAVHEFGHILGLDHEHRRADNPGDCGDWESNPQPNNTDLGLEFDPDSVMYYCSTSGDRLSKWDVYGVGALEHPDTGSVVYGTKPEHVLLAPGGKCIDGGYGAVDATLRTCRHDYDEQWFLYLPQSILMQQGECLDSYGSDKLYAGQCYHDAYQKVAFQGVELRGFGGLCLQPIEGYAIASGLDTELRSCVSGKYDAAIPQRQQWTFDPATNEIRSANGLCLDVQGGTPTPGAPVQVYACHGGANQKWYLEDGRLRSAAGMCIGMRDDDQRAMMVDCATFPEPERWHIAGPVKINGQCLQLAGDSADGTTIGLAACDSRRNDQQFDFRF